MPAVETTINAEMNLESYTILLVNGVDGSTIATIKQNYGTAINSVADPEFTGYEFKGWKLTMEDFDAFLAECEKRDIHVIIDLVMNHSGSEHPWFKEAYNYLQSLPAGAEPNVAECKYLDYYFLQNIRCFTYDITPLRDSFYFYTLF